ncbi:TPA: hypothetical protein PKO72_002822 [Aeromonas hydrophila]|nr:hypothetical protein [Aeromonas hydrophila]MBM0439873.1 hypothetical protein [Aeromonas hydrophila subsp. ranae]QJT11621.1 hypothetical protein E5E97_00990 [Aeromonas sp. 2692-1]EHA1068559.1 hypothetical protein [Aeromonas hydrophila]MBW3830374.1 hypothetical protein [Aeromonas hydrophila]MCW4616268.1 hypothetical protein [Aeromonas hydrophila]
MTNSELISMTQNLDNWVPMSQLPNIYKQFGYSTLKTLFWKRADRPGLERCSRLVGKRLYVNVPLFGLWLAGQLPEQQ